MYRRISTHLIGNDAEINAPDTHHFDEIRRYEDIEYNSYDEHPSNNFDPLGMLESKGRTTPSHIFCNAPHDKKHRTISCAYHYG